MIRKVLRLQYSEEKIGGKFDFRVNDDNDNVEITTSNVEGNKFLNLTFAFYSKCSPRIEHCCKIEILNAKDETLFFFIYLYKYHLGNCDSWLSWTKNISRFCNISALKKENPDLVSGNSEDPMTSPPHIKMALTFGTKDELLPLSSATNIHKLSPIQMLRSILNEKAFDDPKIEAGAIGTLIESSVDRLRSVIDVQNAANILRLAQKYNVESLKEVAVKFVADNFREVMETSGWKEMPDRLTKELLTTILLSTNPSKKAKLDQD